MKTDTITAISTPLGKGGIGIIRISGSDSINIIKKIFLSKTGNKFIPRSHTLTYGHIIDPNTNEMIDEVLIGVMLAPSSYTKEDVVEINCHGGLMPLNDILQTVISQGARLADPGEFTKRAFLNGRIDLAQAEAVIDIIKARTEKSLQQARMQLEGRLSEEISQLRELLINLLSNIEISIDFVEDDVEIVSDKEIEEYLFIVLNKISNLLSTVKTGKIIKEGIRITIAGRPNVGKSSLLNALLNEERAIVTHLPGTTRDIIEEVLEINGIPARIIDTAGIRKTENEIEQAGINLTHKSIKQADIVLIVFDASEQITDEDLEIINNIENKNKIFVLNKSDKKRILDTKQLPSKNNKVKISAINNSGINDLKNTIYNLIIKDPVDTSSEILISNLRHQKALENGKESLLKAYKAHKKGLSAEFIASDIREAFDYLGIIIGETFSEDILNNIFEKFCIGK